MPADSLLPEVYVQPGESRLVHGAARLRTVLGSCVGVTFWHPCSEVGALCHPMLPACPRERSLAAEAGRRYVDFTIRDLARQLDGLGIPRSEIIVKLFGGADVLLVDPGAARPTVGRLNGEAALRVLAEEGFAITASSLGGRRGLHLEFNTATGEVRVRRLHSVPVPGHHERPQRKIHGQDKDSRSDCR